MHNTVIFPNKCIVKKFVDNDYNYNINKIINQQNKRVKSSKITSNNT